MKQILHSTRPHFYLFGLGALLCAIAATLYFLVVWVRNVPATSQFADARLERGPTIELPTCRGLDLGEGKPGDVLVGNFTLTNGGDQPLRFRVESGCGCLRAEPRTGIIDPGGKRELEVAVKLGARGSTVSTVVRVHSDDPKTPVLQLTVAARCPAVVQVSPQHLTFGAVPAGVVHERTLTLTEQRKPRDQLSLRASGEHVKAVWGPGDSPQIKVTILGTAPLGYFAGTVEVADPADQGNRVVIPVTANIAPPLYSAPRSVDLGVLAEGRTFKLIVWKTDGSQLGKLTRVHALPELVVRDRPTGGVGRRLVEISQSGEVGSKGVDELKLWFEGEKEPLVVSLTD